MNFDLLSDYGSSCASASSFMNPWCSSGSELSNSPPDASGNWCGLLQKMSLKETTSLPNLMTKTDAVMKEFRMNGSDSPYDPEDDFWPTAQPPPRQTSYLRQQSWPQVNPKSSAHPRSTAREIRGANSMKALVDCPKKYSSTGISTEYLTQEQIRVLNSVPKKTLLALIQNNGDMNHYVKKNPEECRLCKNNGELEAYYRSHTLKDNSGKVTCPVLRALVCPRCKASGDDAHTIKYCPGSTKQDRIQANALINLRSSMSVKRPAPSYGYYKKDVAPQMYPIAAPSISKTTHWADQALDPAWAALEQKLMQ